MPSVRAAAVLLCLVSWAALAQDKPAEPRSSNMGPGSGNRDGASNGAGTQGSLTVDSGTASSTVSAANTNLGSSKSGGSGSGGQVENDPAQGGGAQKK